jgi:hypothetical protein
VNRKVNSEPASHSVLGSAAPCKGRFTQSSFSAISQASAVGA